MEEVTKCKYIDCINTQEKEEILHELPVYDIGLCVKWLINSGHVNLIGRDLDGLRSMKFFICNNHFTEECYRSKGTLKEDAVPSPHWGGGARPAINLHGQGNLRVNRDEDSTEGATIVRFGGRNGHSDMEPEQWCRTCATRKFDLVSMTAKRKGNEMSLLSKLKLLIEIDDEDALPTKMCDDCVVKLEQSFKFFQQIYVADNTLRQVFTKRASSDRPSMSSYCETRKPIRIIGEEAARKHREEVEREEAERKREEELRVQSKLTRGGVVRRGRGRPRSRGSAARSRFRRRPGTRLHALPSPSSFESPNRSETETATTGPISNVKLYGQLPSKKESLPIIIEKIEQPVSPPTEKGTVFSLLTDTCRTDEELDWTDVLKLMNSQNFHQATKPKNPSKCPTPKKEEAPAKPEIVKPKNPGKLETQYKSSKEPFKVKEQIRPHLSTDDSEQTKYKCTDCVTSYKSPALLSKHRAAHHKDRGNFCDYCHKEFPSKEKLKKHLRECQSREPRYTCESCSKMFASKRVLIAHVKSHLSQNAPPTLPIPSVPQGMKEASNKREKDNVDKKKDEVLMETILDSKSNPKESTIQTPDTKTEEFLLLPSTSNVNDAEQMKIGKETEFVECSDCGEKIRGVEEMRIHQMRCHSIEKKDWTCLLCETNPFNSSEEYEEHVLDHYKRLKITPC